MKTQYYKEFSKALNRDMEYKTYGEKGKMFIVFPAQNGRFYDYENFDMVKTLEPYIENGKITLVCVDSVDIESWSLEGEDYHKRILVQENYYDYINNELLPSVIKKYKKVNKKKPEIYTTGCSMGATHALNFYLRRPDLYKGTIALSGVYHASYFFPNYNDELIYRNSITDYLRGMPTVHEYLPLYRNGKIVICIGQGAWEDEGLVDTKIIENEFKRLDVPAWVDYWGYDVNHDWPWWRTQINYFMKFFTE